MSQLNRPVVFIGMPGCGKTTVCRLTAKRLMLPWYDSDAEIEAKAKKPIPVIFSGDGEQAFRKLEREVISGLLNKNALISLGGGAVKECGEEISGRALTIYIKRPLNLILKTANMRNRPLLSQHENRIFELYEQRAPLFEKYADIIIDNSADLNSVIRLVTLAVKREMNKNDKR